MLIRSKELPSTVERERKELYKSKKGKALLAGAQALQNELQGVANQAMAQSKQERGTTGMPNNELENVMDRFDNHSFKPAVSASSRSTRAVIRFSAEGNKWTCTNRKGGYDPTKRKGYVPLFPKKK